MKEVTELPSIFMGFPGGARHRKLGFSPGTGKNPWKKARKSNIPKSSILAWRIPWTEECGRLQSMRSQIIRHN